MREIGKSTGRLAPGLRALRDRLHMHRMPRRRRRAIFEHIFAHNRWQDAESRSGHGSNLAETAALRDALPGLVARFGARSLLDAPCGDFHWLSQVELGVESYTGIDIVPALIEENRRRYGAAGRTFLVADVVTDPLPRADLVLCRDLLVHLSFADIRRALRNFRASGAAHLLATTFPATDENRNIVAGDWRPLNLERPPFRFPPPLVVVDENCTTDGGRYADKSLGLWALAALDL